MITIGYVDQLGSNPDTIAGLPDTAFKDSGNTQDTTYFPDITVLVLECKRRSPGGDFKAFNLRQ